MNNNYNIQIQKLRLNAKIKRNLRWLADNDYIINKVFLGEWQENDERFIAYKVKRAQVRAEYDKLNAELEAIKETIE